VSRLATNEKETEAMATIRRLVRLMLALGVVFLAGAVGSTSFTHRAAAQAATTITIHATEFSFALDTQTVAAGTVHFVLINDSTDFQHEVWVYPQAQPRLQELLAQKRAGNDVDENDYLQGAVGSVVDIDAGDTASFDGVLAPGVYELACFKQSDIAGATMNHYDMGMHLTITAQ
jgi:uncharacterized cupredoxin-like copper-binding protein